MLMNDRPDVASVLSAGDARRLNAKRVPIAH
jgi:hypothetical protein